MTVVTAPRSCLATAGINTINTVWLGRVGRQPTSWAGGFSLAKPERLRGCNS